MTGIDLRSKRAWALGVLIAFVVIGFQPFFLEALRLDRDMMVRQYDELPYKRVPGLQQTCEAARSHVPRGAAVAFWAPYPKWWEGYSFSYMRASYLLADYRLVPLLDERDRPHPEVLLEVDWLIAVGKTPRFEGFDLVATTDHGAFFRKRR